LGSRDFLIQQNWVNSLGGYCGLRFQRWCDPAHLRTGDYNGDGKTDLSCHSDTTGQHVIRSEERRVGIAPKSWWPCSGAWCDPANLSRGDYNRDGKLDLSCHADNGDHIIAFSNGDGTFTSPGWRFLGWCDPADLREGDYNGDRKTDLSCHSATTGQHVI